MTRLVTLIGFATFAACGGGSAEAKDDKDRPAVGKPVPVALDQLCITKGKFGAKVESGLPIDVPTMRAIAPGTLGDAASMTFWYRGETTDKRALATGGARRQLGLKLRAENGCNLVYVMWRLDPKPKLEVSVKRNPGMKSHEECGANGYVKVKPSDKPLPTPALRIGATHSLRAEIKGDALTAWVDDQVAWEGTLPDEARALMGPAGVRSDNLAFDLVEFLAPAGPPAACKPTDGD
ncbi:MAG: hypothetical protein NT062_15075 [Proteobacteria bacterium]|nr:hypothetical protein [Pseudomonadota bacterium]